MDHSFTLTFGTLDRLNRLLFRPNGFLPTDNRHGLSFPVTIVFNAARDSCIPAPIERGLFGLCHVSFVVVPSHWPRRNKLCDRQPVSMGDL
jgi:hypothetical protein